MLKINTLLLKFLTRATGFCDQKILPTAIEDERKCMEVEEKKYWASGVHFHNRESLVDPDWNAEREREHISRTVALIGGEQI